MYACMYMHVCVLKSVNYDVCMCMYAYDVYMRMYACSHTCIHACAYIRMFTVYRVINDVAS